MIFFQTPIELPKDFTASDLEEEHRLYYFREDIGVNLHHWHWHLVYPTGGPMEVINKDRRGELFYYMHRQVIARYEVYYFIDKYRVFFNDMLYKPWSKMLRYEVLKLK